MNLNLDEFEPGRYSWLIFKSTFFVTELRHLLNERHIQPVGAPSLTSAFPRVWPCELQSIARLIESHVHCCRGGNPAK